ncbi:hypothetical protein I3760_09G118700 [Carya illinoinensis]|nr:hypothetical protein I3760_09G118700 [Carya illinoinensis]
MKFCRLWCLMLSIAGRLLDSEIPEDPLPWEPIDPCVNDGGCSSSDEPPESNPSFSLRPIEHKEHNFGPIPKKSSGSMLLQPTGLITSSPIGSSPLIGFSTGRRSSAHMEPSRKVVYGPSITSLGSYLCILDR